MFHLGRGPGLGECISNNVVGQAVNKVQGALLNDPVDEVVVHVDVLRAHVVLVVTGEGNHGLIVGEKGGWWLDRLEDLGEEAAEPYPLFHAVCCCYILTFSC